MASDDAPGSEGSYPTVDGTAGGSVPAVDGTVDPDDAPWLGCGGVRLSHPKLPSRPPRGGWEAASALLAEASEDIDVQLHAAAFGPHVGRSPRGSSTSSTRGRRRARPRPVQNARAGAGGRASSTKPRRR